MRLVRIAIVTALALLVAAPAAWACGERRSAVARKVPHGAGRAPLIVGDSTLLLSVPVFARAGVEANGRGCRQFSEGIQLIRGRKRAGTLPAVVIVALGANGPIARGQLGALLKILGRRRVLVVVTPRNNGVSQARMRGAARAHPDRVLLADWARYSAGRGGGWFAGDGLHVSNAGAAAYVRFVRGKIAPLAFPPVRRMRMPRHSTGAAKACGRVRGQKVFVVRGKRRITCARARALARPRSLTAPAGWTRYDWRRTGDGPWSWVLARANRRVVVATVAR